MARRLSFGWLSGVLVSVTLGCGSSAPPAETPAAPAPVEAPPVPEPEAQKAPEPEADPVSPAGRAPSDAPAPANSDEQRSIRYVQTPEGLRVEILGVKFVPKAEAVKTPAGIGLKLTLEATTAESRSLLSPQHGPLAFAGAVKRKG